MSEACSICARKKLRVSGVDKTTSTVTGGVLGAALGVVLVASGVAPMWGIVTTAAGAFLGRMQGS